MRVFAVQAKIDTQSITTIDEYRERLLRQVEQEIKPCTGGSVPNLIVFPENMGLGAEFVGQRAEQARKSTSVFAAYFALINAYTSATLYYDRAFPGLETAQRMNLALTDTVWRAVIEPAQEIARDTGAYVVTSAYLSDRVEPSSAESDREALLDQDDDAEKARETVFVAKSPNVYNTSYVIDPNGAIIDMRHKPYLVPSEEADRLLAYGPLDGIRPVKLPFGEFGIVISKDAWMPDVLDRLEIQNTEWLLQPEAFAGWAIEEHAGDWLPDVFQQSGYAAVQKHASFRGSAIPHLAGNFFDLVFDGQSAIVVDAHEAPTPRAYIGREPEPGFSTMAPWVVADDGALSRDERMARLREVGESLRSGGSLGGAYVETVVAAEWGEPESAPITPVRQAGEVQRLPVLALGESSRPSIAANGAGALVMAWESREDGRSRVYVATSADEGKTWSDRQRLGAGDADEHAPSCAMRAADVVCAWQEMAESSAVRAAVSRNGGGVFSLVQAAISANLRDAWVPRVALSPTRAAIAFVAERDFNERVFVAESGDLATFVAAPVDGPAAQPPRNIRNNQWAPAVAYSAEELAVVWTDFRNANWDIVGARKPAGAQAFSPAVRLDDGTDALERINADPSLFAIDDAGGFVVGWSDVRLRKTPVSARVARWMPAGVAPSVVLSDAGGEASSYRPVVARDASGALVAVWQDFRQHRNDIYAAKSADGGVTFGANVRLDDTGDSYGDETRPAGAGASNGAWVAWEARREGSRVVELTLVP